MSVCFQKISNLDRYQIFPIYSKIFPGMLIGMLKCNIKLNVKIAQKMNVTKQKKTILCQSFTFQIYILCVVDNCVIFPLAFSSTLCIFKYIT